MNSLSNEFLVVFPEIVCYLLAEEEACLRCCSWSLRVLLDSCSWRCCEVSCLSSSLGHVSPPDGFSQCDQVVIKKSCSSDSDGDEGLLFPLDDLEYPDCYKHLCCIMPTSSHGWGLFARKVIPAHCAVIAYSGELISNEQLAIRYAEYDKLRLNYVLTIKEFSREQETCEHARKRARSNVDVTFALQTNIDATECGGAARFINHSCNPNTTIVMTRKQKHSVVGSPIVSTIRNIWPGEQLTFDYGEDLCSAFTGRRKLEGQTVERRKCLCGSICCRGWLPNC